MKTNKRSQYVTAILLATGILCLTAGTVAAINGEKSVSNIPTREDHSDQVATEWLSLADAGKGEACYYQLHPYAQGMIGSQEGFSNALHDLRRFLGPVTSRAWTHTESEPQFYHGGLKGDFMAFHFTTSFAHKNNTSETIVLVKDQNGKWKPLYYFVDVSYPIPGLSEIS